VFQDVVDRLTEIGQCYGMEMHVDKAKAMKISRQPSPAQTIYQKQPENAEHFNY
jgi:hypothetical protein